VELHPASQKPAIGLGQLPLARGPGPPLDPYTAVRAGHTLRRTQKIHLAPPQRHKLQTPLRQGIVARCLAPVSRTIPRLPVRGRSSASITHSPAGVFHPAHCRVHKRFEFPDPIRDTLDLHPVSLVALIDGCLSIPSSRIG